MDLTAPPHRWRLVDQMLAGYGVLVAGVAATRLHQHQMWLILVAHLALPLLAWLTVIAPPSRVMQMIRALYPVVMLAGLYSAVDVLNRFGAVHTYDHAAQLVEQAIFGMQPSRDWWRAHPSAFWSTVLHAAYLSYYAIVATPVLWFLATRRSGAIERYLDGLLATYLVCYVCYLFLPVAGPYYEFPRPSGAFIANLPAQWVYSALSGGSAFGAAFPSSHVAATVAATIGAWHGSRRLGLVLAVPTALILVGVVYCQMHYAVDSACGLITGLLVAGTINASWSRRDAAAVSA
ncbi:MAG TPA: phosphatase PAP2 family protein [Gemmatimonadales bacterium]|jgi:membrane-associated phospholipid phosphatase